MKRVAETYGGISSAAVKKATGKTWREWLALLDKAQADKLPHKDIARWLQEKHRLADWWGQMVTVGYEQARGLRLKHQKPDGFEISVATGTSTKSGSPRNRARSRNPRRRTSVVRWTASTESRGIL